MEGRPFTQAYNRLRRLTVLVGLAGLVAALGIGPTVGSAAAAVAPAPHNTAGNWCSSAGVKTSITGATSCVRGNKYSTYANLAAGTYDSAKDNQSSRVVAYFEQYYSGSWHTSRWWDFYDSATAGTSGYSDTYRINKVSGASIYRYRLYACRYNSVAGTGSCGSSVTFGPYNW